MPVFRVEAPKSFRDLVMDRRTFRAVQNNSLTRDTLEYLQRVLIQFLKSPLLAAAPEGSPGTGLRVPQASNGVKSRSGHDQSQSLS